LNWLSRPDLPRAGSRSRWHSSRRARILRRGLGRPATFFELRGGLTISLGLWAFVLGDDEEAEALGAADEAFFLQDVGGLVYCGARDVEFLGDVALGRDPTACR
jgi:hypothetical protein